MEVRMMFLKLGGSVLLSMAFLGVVAAQQHKPVVQTKESQTKTTPEQALQRLKDGNARFIAGQLVDHHEYRVEVPLTAKGQFPFAAFVSCIDARVDVDDIFDLNNGDA